MVSDSLPSWPPPSGSHWTGHHTVLMPVIGWNGWGRSGKSNRWWQRWREHNPTWWISQTWLMQISLRSPVLEGLGTGSSSLRENTKRFLGGLWAKLPWVHIFSWIYLVAKGYPIIFWINVIQDWVFPQTWKQWFLGFRESTLYLSLLNDILMYIFCLSDFIFLYLKFRCGTSSDTYLGTTSCLYPWYLPNGFSGLQITCWT